MLALSAIRAIRRFVVSPWDIAGYFAVSLLVNILTVLGLSFIWNFHMRVVSVLLKHAGVTFHFKHMKMFFAGVNYIWADSFVPSERQLIYVLVGIFVLCVVIYFLKLYHPVRYFVYMVLGVLGVSCVYFIFSDSFPYSPEVFSRIWVWSLTALWFVLPWIYMFVVAILPLGVFRKLFYLLACLLFSYVFSIVRLSFFQASFYYLGIELMPVFYFMFGYLFDFSYFITFYSFALSNASKIVSRKKWPYWFGHVK